VLFPLPVGLLVGACAGPLAVLGAGRLHDRPARPPAPTDAALALALTAAALRAGMPVAGAIDLAAPAAQDPGPLTRVAGLLRLGASPEQAWSVLASDAGWSSIRVLAGRSGHSGIRLADACERSAAELLAQQRTAAVARAQRVSVLAVGPLGACFLPAFVCLGIVPVVLGVALGVGGQIR
jgi:Flp pilus assembly protein TadB